MIDVDRVDVKETLVDVAIRSIRSYQIREDYYYLALMKIDDGLKTAMVEMIGRKRRDTTFLSTVDEIFDFRPLNKIEISCRQRMVTNHNLVLSKTKTRRLGVVDGWLGANEKKTTTRCCRKEDVDLVSTQPIELKLQALEAD